MGRSFERSSAQIRRTGGARARVPRQDSHENALPARQNALPAGNALMRRIHVYKKSTWQSIRNGRRIALAVVKYTHVCI